MVREHKAESARLAAGEVAPRAMFRVVGQEGIRTRLADGLRSHRAAHAYLFAGPRGIGKAAVALEFAALLLCDEPGASPCGSCVQCQMTRRLQHPDLHLVFPLPPIRRGRAAKEAEEDETTAVAERLAKLIERLADNLYSPIALPKLRGKSHEPSVRDEAMSIKAGQIRSMLHEVALKPFQARRKVFVVFEADSMNPTSQNRLLKCLEEPPAEGYFLLITENEAVLLPTIRSRCQRVPMKPLDLDEIVTALVEDGVTGDVAESAANLAGGSLVRAREFVSETVADRQKRAVDFLAFTSNCDPTRLAAETDTFMERGDLAEYASLDLLRLFLRDVAVRRAAGDDSGAAPLAYGKFSERIDKLLRSHPQVDIEAAARAVDEAQSQLEHGYTRELVLIVLTIRLSEALGPRATTAKTRSAQHA